jgi:hypothetical protein
MKKAFAGQYVFIINSRNKLIKLLIKDTAKDVATHMAKKNYAPFYAQINTKQRLAEPIMNMALVLMVFDVPLFIIQPMLMQQRTIRYYQIHLLLHLQRQQRLHHTY